MQISLAVAALIANASAIEVGKYQTNKSLLQTVKHEETLIEGSVQRIKEAIGDWQKVHTKWITQKEYEDTCVAPLQRALDEAEGSIYVEEGTLFEDVSFPTKPSSLSSKPNMINPEWKRPTELESNPSLWGHQGVRPAAIRPGSLRNYWFLGSLAALNEKSERLHNLFTYDDTYPSDGKFEVNFWMQGKQLQVTVDDRLPVQPTESGFIPSYTKRSDDGWWASIVEKAAAKFYGHYESLNGGFMDQALWVLTGMPTVSLRNNIQTD
jgi:hypothetical protein